MIKGTSIPDIPDVEVLEKIVRKLTPAQKEALIKLCKCGKDGANIRYIAIRESTVRVLQKLGLAKVSPSFSPPAGLVWVSTHAYVPKPIRNMLKDIWGEEIKAAKFTVLFDKFGRVALDVTDDGAGHEYYHVYDDPAQAAQDVRLLLDGATTEDWDGRDDPVANAIVPHKTLSSDDIYATLANLTIHTNADSVREFFIALRTSQDSKKLRMG